MVRVCFLLWNTQSSVDGKEYVVTEWKVNKSLACEAEGNPL